MELDRRPATPSPYLMNTDQSPIPSGDPDQDDLFEHYKLVVDKGQSPLRIDRYLDIRMGMVSRNRIQNAIKAGSLLVNGGTVKSSYKVKPLDTVRLVLAHPPKIRGIEAQNIPVDIRYEDSTLLIVHKAPGMVVHPGHGHHDGTLVNALAYHLGQLPVDSHPGSEGEIRPGLVHRIDKDTSGLLVIAKTEIAMTHLAQQFFDHSIDRTYQALVWGCPEAEGTYRAHIDRDPKDRLKMKGYTDGSKGKAAVTHYRRLENLGPVSLMEYRLETGRTHQIRVHTSMHGHPIFGDGIYGGDAVLKGSPSGAYHKFVHDAMAAMPRMALHAKTLGFVHPDLGIAMSFDSDLPPDFAGLLRHWRFPPPSVQW